MDHLAWNREAWDRRTRLHVDSKFYDVEGFLAGTTSLRAIELAGLSDVAGKRLLHLQCHFGLDTLSWNRRGAIVTGVDFSPVAIEKANEIRDRAGLAAEFVCADVYEFGQGNRREFDIVYASYGALIWLPRLDAWAEVVSRHLRAGGTFYLVEFHPVHDFIAGYPYFGRGEPIVEEEGTYTENCDGEKSRMVTWAHPPSAVINALIRAGIRIDRFDEFPYSPYDCFEGLEEREPGRFHVAGSKHDMPLVYSILGTRTE